jgi:hypothetical protein
MGLARRANVSNDLSYLNSTAQPEEEEIDGRWGRKGRTHFWRNSTKYFPTFSKCHLYNITSKLKSK